MKICTRCRGEKPLLQFKKQSRRASGYSAICKECSRIYEAKRRASKEHSIPSHKVCFGCNRKLPCVSFHKHSGMSDGLSHRCRECTSEYHADWYKKNAEKKKKASQVWVKKNPERKKSNDKRRYDIDKSTALHHATMRFRRKQKATPAWLNEEQKSKIRMMYWLASDLFAISGEPYEVDHIIPIKGKGVCGLHVPWNLQILPKDINRSKGNK